jgi:hypothetical protein
MTRATSEQPWSTLLAISDVPETGRSVAITADERTRAAIAEVAGLRSLPRLEATFDVALHGRDGLHVSGRVTATVGQNCVVTLEPIESEVIEGIDLVFAPAAAPVIVEEDGDKVEIAAVDAPEPLSGGTVDLGAIATEFLLLGINSYPRKPGAVFEPPTAGPDTGGPFAALKALRKSSGGPR